MKRIIILLMVSILLLGAFASHADSSGPYRTGYIEGFVKGQGDRQIQIEEYDGTVHTLPISQFAELVIDQVPVSLNEFKVGMEVYGELKSRQIHYLESYATENPGFIPPGSKVRSGVVKRIDRNQLILQSPLGREERYFTAPSTIALKRGKNVPLSTLYEGDRVKLYFDEVNSDVIHRMEIEGDSILIKDLYRGKLEISDTLGDYIVVDEAEVLRNDKWEKAADQMRLPYSTETSIYVGGQKVLRKDLKLYKGRTVYMALKDHFGKNKIEKMVIKSRYETLLSNKITGINWYAGVMEMGNMKNIGFHDGTMVIKNGRLVDKQSIHLSSDALVIADGSGRSLMADVIQIYNEGLNNSNIGQTYLYAGRLNTILEDRVYLYDYFLLENNEWYSYRTYGEKDEKQLFYDNDTTIYDTENNIKVSPKEFYAKHYAVDEGSGYARQHNLKDWYGYLLTDGDRIASLIVQKKMDSLLAQRMTLGIIEKTEDDPLVGWAMTIRDGKDWSSINQKWMPKSIPIRVNVEKAMIVKDGKTIQPEDLRPGDRLYMVRDDFQGKVVVVK